MYVGGVDNYCAHKQEHRGIAELNLQITILRTFT